MTRILWVFILISCASCSFNRNDKSNLSSNTIDFNADIYKDFNFKILYPADWKKEKINDYCYAYHASCKDSIGFCPNFAVTFIPVKKDSTTLVEYMDFVLGKYKTEVDSFSFSNRISAVINSFPTEVVEYRAVAGKDHFGGLVAIVKLRDKAYLTIYCGAPDNQSIEYGRYISLFQKVIHSVKTVSASN